MSTLARVAALTIAASATAGGMAADSAKSAFPGRNGQIAFQSGRTGAYNIFVMAADGSSPTQITETGNNENPSWSPDATRLAFESDRTGGGDVYVANANGTSLRQVTFSQFPDLDPAWSPNGRTIAFESFRTGRGDVYAAAADGGSERRLTDSPTFDGDPAWSPDGTRIAFTSLRDGNLEIYAMNANGSNVVRLTNTGGAVADPSIVGVDGDPSWSPDGRRIVFTSNRDDNFEVYVMNADGSGQTNVSDHPALDAFGTFSPDGRLIAFMSERGGVGNRDIYTMAPSGGSPTQLTSLPGWDTAPDWARVRTGGGAGGCTATGTNGPDRLRGTIGPDTICGLKGNDVLHGGRGNDTVRGGAGNDALYGDEGSDALFGEDGNDTIFARDGRVDRISGGRGRDRAVVDRNDRVSGVERVVRPKAR